MGETEHALEFYEKALNIGREVGDKQGEGYSLHNISIALHKLGNCADAITNAEAALRIFEQIEDPTAESTRNQLAEWRKQS